MTNEQIRDKMVDHPDMPRVGSTVSARYEVLSVLGEGGFAVVYKARDHKLGGVLALKVLDPRKSNDPAFEQRFQQEISIVRALRHHNTVKIWDAMDWTLTREEFPQYQLERYQAWLKKNEAKK